MATLDIVIRAQNQAGGVLNGLKRDLQSFSRQAQSVGTALSLGVTAPFALFAKTGIETVAEFSRTMAELEVVTGASGAALETLNSTAIKLGAETSFSANEAAQAMLELSKAGMGTEDVLSSIPGVLALAAAGSVDLGYAANLTASSLNAFQLSADQSGYVANLLAAAANESSANITDLAYGLQQGGFAFSAANQDIDDLAASMAILTNVGLTGSDAGTALKNAFTRLMAPTDDAAKLMDRLNLRFYDSQGTMLPLADIIGVLNTKLGGMTDEQRNAALVTLFLNDGMKAMIPLLDIGKDGFLEMKDAVNQAGAAQEVADAKMRGLAGAFEYASGSIESALLNVFGPLEGVLSDIIRAGADFITWLSELPRPVLNAALAFTAVLAAAGPLLLAIPAIGALLGALLSPIGLVVLAVAALAATWAADFGGIQEITKNVVDEIITLFQNLWTAIAKNDTTALMTQLNNLWSALKFQMAIIALRMKNQIGQWIVTWQSWVADVWPTLSENLVTLWTDLSAWITGKVDLLYTYLYKWATEFWAWAGEVWAELSPKLVTMFESVTGWIAEKALELPGKFTEWVTAFVDWAIDAWMGVEPQLKEYSASVVSWAQELGPTLQTETNKWAKILIEWVPKKEEIQTSTKPLGTGLVDGIIGLQETVSTAFGYMIGAALGGTIRLLTDAISIFVIGIIGSINMMMSSEESTNTAADGLGKLMSGMFANAGKLIGAMVKGFVDQINAALTGPVAQLMDQEWAKLTGNISRAWANMTNTITTTTVGWWATIVGHIAALMAGIWTGISLGWALIQALWNTATTNISTGVQTWIANVLTIVSAGMLGIELAWQAMVDNLKSIVLDMRTAIRMAFMTMKLNIESTISAIKMAVLIDFALMKLRMEGIIGDAKAAVVGKFEEIKGGFETAAAALFTAVQTRYNEIKDWIGGLSIPNPFAKLMSWANEAKSAVQSVLGMTGGGSSGNNAAGTPYFRGGLTTINERGTELLALPGRNRNVWLPRGTSIIPAERVPMMAGAAGGVTVNLYATINNDMDAESIAWQVAAVLRRNQR